jgi:hypothetical protein
MKTPLNLIETVDNDAVPVGINKVNS